MTHGRSESSVDHAAAFCARFLQGELDALETADRTQRVELQAKTVRLQETIATLRDQMHRLARIKTQLADGADGQLSVTDRDARSMISQSKGHGHRRVKRADGCGCETSPHRRSQVTNVGSDRAQLAKMATAARDAMGKTRLRAYADRGYYNAPEIKACADAAGHRCICP